MGTSIRYVLVLVCVMESAARISVEDHHTLSHRSRRKIPSWERTKCIDVAKEIHEIYDLKEKGGATSEEKKHLRKLKKGYNKARCKLYAKEDKKEVAQNSEEKKKESTPVPDAEYNGAKPTWGKEDCESYKAKMETASFKARRVMKRLFNKNHCASYIGISKVEGSSLSAVQCENVYQLFHPSDAKLLNFGKHCNQYYKEKRAKEEQMAERELTDSEKIFQEERAKRLNKVFKGQRSVPDPRADWDFGKGPESPPTVQYTRTELEAQQKKRARMAKIDHLARGGDVISKKHEDDEE